MPDYISSNYYGKFSPLRKKGGIPDYDRESEAWEQFVKEQKHYCLHGFDAGGDHIGGRLYFKLNFTTISIADDNGYKQPSAPYYVDSQREIYDTIDECAGTIGKKGTGENVVVGKARDKGFSDDIAALSLYECMFMQNAEVLALFPGGKSPALNNFRNKYQLSFENLLEDFKHYPGIVDNLSQKHYGWIEKDEKGQEKKFGINSSLTMLHAVDADVSKSGRYKFIYMDEFGEINEPLKLIETARANMREGSKKNGMFITGGTSNAFSKSGYRDFRKLCRKHQEMGFRWIFIPAQKAYWGYVNLETGESDQVNALADIKQIGAGKTGQDLMIYQQNYPTSEEEMFTVINKSPFNPQYISKQIGRIETDKTIQIQVGDLLYNEDRSVRFRLNPKGLWKIFQHPDSKLPKADLMATDPYRLSEVNESEVESMGAIVVRRPFQGINKPGSMPIALCKMRDKDKDKFFEENIKAELYWNAKNLIEHTDADIFKYHEDMGMLKMLKKRPQVIKSEWSKADYNYGVKPTKEAIDFGTELAVKDFEANWENIFFIEILEDLNNFGIENTDLGMAHMWSIVHAADNEFVTTTKKQNPAREANFQPYLVEKDDGSTIWVDTYDFHKMINNIY